MSQSRKRRIEEDKEQPQVKYEVLGDRMGKLTTLVTVTLFFLGLVAVYIFGMFVEPGRSKVLDGPLQCFDSSPPQDYNKRLMKGPCRQLDLARSRLYRAFIKKGVINDYWLTVEAGPSPFYVDSMHEDYSSIRFDYDVYVYGMTEDWKNSTSKPL